MTDYPILYSFRRCPYAMRARLAILVTGIEVELREVVLKDKAPAFLVASPTATVPCLVKESGHVIDESIDIMLWALEQADPQLWLVPEQGNLQEVQDLIRANDGPFKCHLDRYKYDTRFEGAVRTDERAAASEYLRKLDQKLDGRPWLFGARASIADYAILPFVRQFANTDRDWFDAQSWSPLKRWLAAFEGSDAFLSVMSKYRKWSAGDVPLIFKGDVGVFITKY
ncbi:glutathione S-transferase [Roseibium sp. RKSG952]|uniref:glutathione S-transferase n=1 Tax=Roseibium sp. RKSG952 TaxID=2529384 RepID=UPI0012BD2FC1|nr:glutathione S-transferase [Roseibium sp. RKSG952]MTH98940.1 glutathione S-transferase [Roseibium sp. RKSG952]